MTRPCADDNSGFIIPAEYDGDAAVREFTDLTEMPSHGESLLFKARRYGRWWVLKTLRHEYADDPLYADLLRKEFDITISMQHPNIVSAVSLEDVAGLGLSIVMEWVDGITLTEWLAQKPSRARRRRVFYAILSATGYIHSLQTAHRDLKPANILITRNGENVKIIDFGLGDTDSHASLKQPAGTPGYISPEQYTMPTTDARNDIFSLGTLLRLMHMGYGGVVRRCHRPIDRRYNSVQHMRRAMHRADVRRKWLAATAALAVIAAVMWGYSASHPKADPAPPLPPAPSVAVQQPAPDTVTAAPPLLQSSPKASAPQPTVDRHSSATPEPKAPQTDADIQRLVADAYPEIDRLVAASGIMQKADTATSQEYLKTDGERLNAKINEYAAAYSNTHADGNEATARGIYLGLMKYFIVHHAKDIDRRISENRKKSR